MVIVEFPQVDWTKFIPTLQFFINNSINSIGSSANEIITGIKLREVFDNTLRPDAPLLVERFLYKNEAIYAIVIANAFSKIYYDARYKPLIINPGD